MSSHEIEITLRCVVDVRRAEDLAYALDMLRAQVREKYPSINAGHYAREGSFAIRCLGVVGARETGGGR